MMVFKKIVIVFVLRTISIISCYDDMNRFHDSENKPVQIDLYGENTLDIDLSRLDDNMHGVKQLNNRWSLEEIDIIL